MVKAQSLMFHRFVTCMVFCAGITGAELCNDYAMPDELEPCDIQMEPEPIVRYKDPAVAMMLRYRKPVEIEIRSEWGLSEPQLYTAMQPPYGIVKSSRVVRYVYPEDEEPTPEQLADGSALTPKQRRLMRRARRLALRNAAWQAKIEADRYNREHAEALEQQDRCGRHIIIDLSAQRGVFMDGSTELRSFRVCSGKKTTPTPRGHFHVMEKRREHKSNLYNSSMPYFLRLTLDGVGLHQGPVRSRPSSHGCIRLRPEDARYLFENSVVGTAVFVVD